VIDACSEAAQDTIVAGIGYGRYCGLDEVEHNQLRSCYNRDSPKPIDREEQTLNWQLDRETFEQPERTDARVGAIARGGRQSTSLALGPVGNVSNVVSSQHVSTCLSHSH